MNGRENRRVRVWGATLAACILAAGAWPVLAVDSKPGAAPGMPQPVNEEGTQPPARETSEPVVNPIKSVVEGRLVCCADCKAKLDQANGLKKCAACEAKCNVAHRYCSACAKKLGVCEVCGKQMQPPLADGLQKKHEMLKRDMQAAPLAAGAE